MNTQNDRVTIIVVSLIIALALIYTFISVKKRLSPSVPPPVGLTNPPLTTAPPTTSPSAGANAGTASAKPGAPAANAPSGPAKPGAPAINAPSSPANPEETSSVLPDQPFKIVVRDPFALTPSYGKELLSPDVNVSASIAPPESNSTKGRASKSRKIAVTPKSAKKGFGDIRLPPAIPTLKPEALPGARSTTAPGGEFARQHAPRNDSPAATSANIATATAPTNGASPGASASSDNSKPKTPTFSYVLTGTIDGETPMAILRSNERNYLVKVGDWLEGDYQVMRISPRRVVISDSAGRSKILNLGVFTHAS